MTFSKWIIEEGLWRLMGIFKPGRYLQLTCIWYRQARGPCSSALLPQKPSSRFPPRLSHTLHSLIALPPSAFSFFPFPRLYPDLPSSDCTPLPALALWKSTSRWRQQILFCPREHYSGRTAERSGSRSNDIIQHDSYLNIILISSESESYNNSKVERRWFEVNSY